MYSSFVAHSAAGGERYYVRLARIDRSSAPLKYLSNLSKSYVIRLRSSHHLSRRKSDKGTVPQEETMAMVRCSNVPQTNKPP